jgi:ABC-type nickel/cobalt efflux system permease component RcnA
LILLEEITLPTLLVALAVSFIWGAMHAMTPGHGKTIVGAYLVGSRGTPKHALYLGLTTTITHTLGVFALGLVTLFAAQYILPETLYPWMSLLSGLFVVGIGVNLLISRSRSSGIWFPKFRPHTSGSEHSHSLVFQHTATEAIGHGHKNVLKLRPRIFISMTTRIARILMFTGIMITNIITVMVMSTCRRNKLRGAAC